MTLRPSRLLFSSMLAAILGVGCIPEPTPHVERPVDLEPPPLLHAAPDETFQPLGLPVGALVTGMFGKASLGLLERPLQLSENHAPEADILPSALTLLVTANVRAELNLCACTSPRGGLARRAGLLSKLRESAKEMDERAPIVIDAGDALASVIAPPPSKDELPAVERATVLLEVYGEMGVDALLINLRDLRVGRERLLKLARKHRVPLLSSNLIDAESGEPIADTHRVIERDGLRIGLVGLTPDHLSEPSFLKKQGLALKPNAQALREAMGALRESGDVDAILLVSGLGMHGTTLLLNAWDDDATEPPDLVLLSGSARLTQQPTWVAGVAVLEPGEGGRQVLLLTLVPDEEGKLNLSNRGGARLEAQGELLASLRRFANSWRILELDAFNPNRQHELDKQLNELNSRVEGIGRLQGALSGGPATDVVPGFGVEIVELSESLEPDADIQRLVDPLEREDEVPQQKKPRTPQQRMMDASKKQKKQVIKQP